MITITPKHFYRFVNNVEFCLKKNKIKTTLFTNDTINIRQRFYDNRYRRKCEEVYICYNNSHFKAKDFGIYILHNLIFKENFLQTPNEWNVDEIPNISYLYTEKILKKDVEKITKVLESINLTDVKNIGIIQSSGTSIVYDWVKNGSISPIYLMFNKKILCSDGENEDHKRMRLVVELMMNLFKQKNIV